MAATNDTYTPPAITLGSGMNGDHLVVVSGARDLSGSELTRTNVLLVRVDVIPPSAPVVTPGDDMAVIVEDLIKLLDGVGNGLRRGRYGT